jgi:hypothetical protein
MVVTGSYDEHARLWDIRQIGRPVIVSQVRLRRTWYTLQGMQISGEVAVDSFELQEEDSTLLQQLQQSIVDLHLEVARLLQHNLSLPERFMPS